MVILKGNYFSDLRCGYEQRTTSAQANPATLNGRRTSTNAGISIDSIANYAEVYKLVKQLQEDIYTDVMYPNDLRPSENHGYKSRYKG